MTAKPVIARIWRGRTTLARADEYASYLYEVGIRPLEEKALAVMQLREDRECERSEPRKMNGLGFRGRHPSRLVRFAHSRLRMTEMERVKRIQIGGALNRAR
jgi:hypothetical protein